MNVPSYLFYSLLFKLPNKGMSFLFPSLKASNKEREEYSKIIHFIHFHSILFPFSKRGLNAQIKTSIEIVFTSLIPPITWLELEEGFIYLLLLLYLRMQKSDVLKALEIGNFYLAIRFLMCVRVKIVGEPIFLPYFILSALYFGEC